MEIQKSIRYRVNISTSVKGIKTWDCTVDAENIDMEGVFALSDEMVRKLEERYPISEVLK